MAIEHRALFALSVAFTASIVAYPDLPPDIPPRAGHDGAFVGAPFVAFLLPVAAAAMWWIIASLDQRASRAASPVRSAGAATALFLSAFHITMLIALVGGWPWLGRVLGVVVGLFLMATGNELPRVRPNLAWGIRTRQTLASDELWRRVHRLGGYIRVLMGAAVSVAALSGVRGFEQLIVAAVCLETVVCVAAGLLLSRQATAAVLMLVMCGIAADRVDGQAISAEKLEALPALIDATVPKLMEAGHVPGAAVAVVHEGRVVLLRGYGRSRLAPDVMVDASRTLFRVGSVSKVLTSVAALRLVDEGKLDLTRDVRQYLPDVPLRFGATMHQLLTHTAGLDERFAGAFTDGPAHLQSLSDHLRRNPPAQVTQPGTAYSYSNYNFAIAGLVIERLSGVAFDQFMAQHVFGPLGATASTAHQPVEPSLARDLAQGYQWSGGRQVPLPYRYPHSTPSGGISTTAADMSRFMLALLGDGAVDGRRLLSPDALTRLLTPQYTPDPHIPPRNYAFLEWHTRGRVLMHHDGTLGDQLGALLLAPADRFGIFVASNGAPDDGANQVGNLLLEPVLTHLLGPAAPTPAPPAPMPDAHRRAFRVAGTYRDLHHTRNDLSRIRALMPMIQSRVTVEPDGAIRWQGRRWLEVEPLIFRSLDRPGYSADRPDHIVFRENERGEVSALHAWGATYERIGWPEQTPFHLAIFAMCVVSFLAYTMWRTLRAMRRRADDLEGARARACATFVALANLVFVAGLAGSLRELGEVTPLAWPSLVLLSIPVVSLAVTALLPAFAASAWREGWWTWRERVGYSTFAVVAVAFMTFLNYWKLLGIRY